MPWQASPQLQALGGLSRSRLHTYYQAARAEAMVDVDAADQRYQAFYGTPYEHGRSDERSTQRWQLLAQRAMPEPDQMTQRRTFLAPQTAAAEASLFELEGDLGKAVIGRPPPIVTALLKGRPVDERLRIKDPAARTSPPPDRAGNAQLGQSWPTSWAMAKTPTARIWCQPERQIATSTSHGYPATSDRCRGTWSTTGTASVTPTPSDPARRPGVEASPHA